MAYISSVRAGCSGLPFVGPFIALYNATEIRKDLRDTLIPPLAIAKKGVVYSTFGIAGQLSSIAIAVGFVALGILTAYSAFLYCVFLAPQLCGTSYLLYRHYEAYQSIQKQLSQ